MHVQCVGAGCSLDFIRCKTRGVAAYAGAWPWLQGWGDWDARRKNVSLVRQPNKKVRDGREEGFALSRSSRGNPREKEKSGDITGTSVMAMGGQEHVQAENWEIFLNYQKSKILEQESRREN